MVFNLTLYLQGIVRDPRHQGVGSWLHARSTNLSTGALPPSLDLPLQATPAGSRHDHHQGLVRSPPLVFISDIIPGLFLRVLALEFQSI